MLRPSGAANMRCSAYRLDPGRCSSGLRQERVWRAQRPGAENRRYRDLRARQRPHAPRLNRGKARKSGPIRQTLGHFGSYGSGPGRTRTCNQAVMSLALTIESGPIRALRCVCWKLRFSDSNIFTPTPDRAGRGHVPPRAEPTRDRAPTGPAQAAAEPPTARPAEMPEPEAEVG